MTTTTITKEQWLEEYAGRVLKIWHIWQGPLGVDDHYIEQLKLQLNEFFDDPLKRDLIETTYGEDLRAQTTQPQDQQEN